VSALPLVFVPALGSDERSWRPVAEELGDTIETFVVRGVGDSLSGMADDILARSPERFALAGNSMGGYVALEIALRRSQRVEGLALLNSSAVEADPQRRENSRRIIAAVGEGRFEEAVTAMSRAVAPRRDDVAELAAAMARDLGEDVLVAQQTAVMNRPDRRAELPMLDIPTLVIAGSEDLITPADLARQVENLAPDVELVILPGVGHLSTLEAPRDVATHLARWHASLSGSVVRS
jgi:pimeloyl-ACP methyl ester carboxylesterase